MEVHGRNPWLVEDLDDFYFLCCPECIYKSKDDEAFIDHAVENHPNSKASNVFSEAEQELSRQKTFQRYTPKGNNLLAEVKLAKQTREQKHVQKEKKVVKVISTPNNVDLIDMLKEEGIAEESQIVEYDDPDDFGALESINDESIDCKLIASFFFLNCFIFLLDIHDLNS
jgi:hypothetical protein